MSKIVDIILFNEDRILLVQHKKSKAYGLWGLPGGHVEDGESPDAAIAREVYEELGLTIDASECKKIEHIAEDRINNDRLMVTTFIASEIRQKVTLQEDELIGFGWFTLVELKGLSPSLRSSWILKTVEHAASLRV